MKRAPVVLMVSATVARGVRVTMSETDSVHGTPAACAMPMSAKASGSSMTGACGARRARSAAASARSSPSRRVTAPIDSAPAQMRSRPTVATSQTVTENTTADAAVATPNARARAAGTAAAASGSSSVPGTSAKRASGSKLCSRSPRARYSAGGASAATTTMRAGAASLRHPRAIAAAASTAAGSVIAADERQRPDAELAGAAQHGPDAPGDVGRQAGVVGHDVVREEQRVAAGARAPREPRRRQRGRAQREHHEPAQARA